MRTATTATTRAGGFVLPWVVLGLLVVSGPATAQVGAAGGAGADGRWLPYMGCWEPTGSADALQEGMLCIRPAAERDGVEFLRVRDGVVADVTVRPVGGARQPVEREGCTGWESASFSDDGHRVYLRSDVTCRGGVRRTTSGIMSMVSPYEWIDVEAVAVDGRSRPWVRRYRLAPPSRTEDAGMADIAADLRMAVEAARTAAAEPPEVPDVIEASGAVESVAVEAWIAELRDPFRLDADALVRMADAGVEERVIDVMVAVSYPDRFELEGEEPRMARADGPRAHRRRPARYFGGPAYGAHWGYGIYDPFYGRYGGFGLYRPYGLYGVGFGFYRGYRPSVVVVRPRADRGGRVVNGRGYTRSRGSGDAGSRSMVPDRRPRGGGSVSPAGISGGSGSKSTGRKAKKRGGKGGGGDDGGSLLR